MRGNRGGRPENDAAPVPLSPFQRREWVLWKMAEGRNGRVVAAARRLEGGLDVSVVRARLKAVVGSHASLRLAFHTDEPIASIESEPAVPLDVRRAGIHEPLTAAVARLSREASRPPFTLSSAPALRAVLVRAGGEEAPEAALVLVAHPIIADEHSLACLLEEIDAGGVPQVPDAFFLSWAAILESPERKAAEGSKLSAYKRMLEGASLAIDIPADRPRPAEFKSRGDVALQELPDSVRNLIELTAASLETRPEVVVLAAVIGYLGRVSRQPDVVIGLGRDLRPEACATAVGPFENTSVLRISLEAGLTCRGLIERVRDRLAALEPVQDLPFERLIETLQPERDLSRPPIFQVRFASCGRRDDGAWLAAPTGHVSADLEIVLDLRKEVLALRLAYQADLFDQGTVQRMGVHLVELLRGMCGRPDEPPPLISLCGPEERAWILSALGVQRKFPSEATIHGLVSLCAARHPEDEAVCCGDARLSYGELNRRANQLAHRLRGSGVGRDVAVAVCMERSEELIIALLAVLKAGGAYLPIEPANPRERIEFVLTDSKALIILTEPALKDKVSGSTAQVILLEPGGHALSSEPTTDPEDLAGPESAAYIIYTSGSTGRPKGVVIEHRNVVRLFEATHDWFLFGRDDVWSMFHSVAFDFSVWEIWGALVYGGRLVVVPYLVSRSPEDFRRLLVREKVTVLNQTPSAFRQLISADAEMAGEGTSLRLVIFGGEALEFESLRPWFERHGDQVPRLVNMYGITETCVHVTYRPISMKDLELPRGASLIGVPIPDLCTYVVDERLELLPAGVPGELVVGGAGLARGYLSRPELTRERFVPNPFSDVPGDRLYRSGDLVRLLPTGELDYLGRIDLQVKVRGFRIETGEIEAVLRRSGLVRDAAVLPWQHPSQGVQLAAYVVSDHSADDLRAAVRASLPEYMVPSRFVAVPAIPMTINGKVDRKALPLPQELGTGEAPFGSPPGTDLEKTIAQVWCEVLGVDRVGVRESFFDMGGNSLGIVRVAALLRERLGRIVDVVSLFQYPSVASLARHLARTDEIPMQKRPSPDREHPRHGEAEPVAIVGMAGRFPGAQDVEALWNVLVKGQETITFFSPEDLDPSLDPALVSDSAYVRARGILEGADLFDAAFFGMTPREAEVTDPQQRLLLELAWEALEHAGCNPSEFPGLIGVYAGEYNDTYYTENVLKRPDVLADVGPFQAMLGNEKDFAATRIAHRLDLKGPALGIYTACSTSLVAVVHAFHALRTRQCDLALAGAASVTCPQKSGYLYQEGGMLSPDGHTRPFDRDAKGTVFSDGAAMVVLRRLSDAISAGDTIYAVIRGAATNNDGSQRMSFSAPTVDGQARVIGTALAVAGVHPETIGYVEAHGTATPLGDPIEVEGLRQAFSAETTRSGFCALGSVKSNIGHITAAAGAAGLIKTALALDRELIPPTVGFSAPNPEIPFESTPFFVAADLLPWPRMQGKPRRAGVSSFGVGGTNAHVIVEEAPAPAPGGPSRPKQLLVLSARTGDALETMTENLAAHLEGHPEMDLADVAFTLQRGRKPFSHRRAVVASSREEAVRELKTARARPASAGKAPEREPSIVFLFPGQGAQYVDMGRELYESESVFRDGVDECSRILMRHLDLDLRAVMYPSEGRTGGPYTKEDINHTWLAQPAIFVVEYALSRLWMSWGVKPSALIGHSIGEYVAAVLADTFALEDALALLAARARLMQALPPGSMLSVRMGAEILDPMLPEGVSLAAVNSPNLCVVSGPTDLVRDFQTQLESRDVATRPLHTSHAFHSAMMDPMLAEFAPLAGRTRHRPPSLPWVSTCTGRWMTTDDLASGEYWVRQVRQPVRFAEALNTVVEDPDNVFLEAGPGQTLQQLVRQHAGKSADLKVISTLGPVGEPDRDLHTMLTAVGRLWMAGAGVSWESFCSGEKRKKVPLPTYPFERKRYWLDPVPAVAAAGIDSLPSGAPGLLKTDETEVPAMPAVPYPPPAPPLAPRKDRLAQELTDMFQSWSGAELGPDDRHASFLDLGFDSLLLTQASQGVFKRFGVRITFRQMVEDLSSINILAAFLDEKLPSEAPSRPADALASGFPAPGRTGVPPAPAEEARPASGGGSPSGGDLMKTVIQQQMAIMNQQLELLRRAGLPAGSLPGIQSLHRSPEPAPNRPVVQALSLGKQTRFGPFKAIEKGRSGGLTKRQQEALGKLVDRYNRRTAKSKAMAQEHRARFCDPRAAGNFRQLWKEMVYPIVCARSKGSRIWDIDGNEYIDVTMGFGANYLGHSPDFVMQALDAQMQLGIEIGPQSPIAGEVAGMICEMTGMDRATFCNTGSEAVMAALRVARTVTGRDKIVYFQGDYHGIFDEVLGRPALVDGLPGAMPIAPGIPHLANAIILEYGSDSALETIRKHSGEIAAVLVEPVQSRHPDLQPREFLKELRRITEEKEIALIFDEVITGFRVAPGGAQEYFEVRADLATYGKVVGGGMPIGVLAGSATYMDALDGGMWQYGDDSSPPTGVTFFAGTFVRHPLAMAAAHAVLTHLKSAGPGLQERVNLLTARFVDRTNAFLEELRLPMKLQPFSAIFYYDFDPELKFAGLLFYYLRDCGIHIWEGRVGCLSAAHTEQDMDRVFLGFRQSIEEMVEGGFLPDSDESRNGKGGIDRGFPDTGKDDVKRVPLIDAQREIWVASRVSDMASCAYNESTAVHLRGRFDADAMKRAFQRVIARHEALRTTFSEDGEIQRVAPSLEIEVPFNDVSDLAREARDQRISEILQNEVRRPFDLERGPLLCVQLIRIQPDYHLLVTTAHHIVCDGWSFDVMMTDLSRIYSSICRGEQDDRELPMQMSEYALWQERNRGTPEVLCDESFWLARFADSIPVLDLRSDRPRPPVKSYRGARETRTLDELVYAEIKKVGAREGATLYSTLLAAFAVLLYRLSGQRDLVIGILAAGQSVVESHDLVGHCTNLLPLRVPLDPDLNFRAFLRQVKQLVLDAYEHQKVTFGTLIAKLRVPRDSSRTPLVSVMFNIDPAIRGMDFKDLTVEYLSNPRCAYQFDLGFNLIASSKSLLSECDYTTDLFDGKTIHGWLGHYHTLIAGIAADPDRPLSALPLLTDSEARTLVEEWNKTRKDYPRDATVHGLFEAEAGRTPEATAVVSEGDSITYGELNRRANQLALHLRSLGVGPDTMVGIFLDRSVELVIALLGVLKAGGAYLPLDPAFPKERLAFMAEDSGLAAVITQETLAGDLPAHGTRLVFVDRDRDTVRKYSDANVESRTESGNLAYVIYTSGSTGKPKGVQVLHRSVVNLLLSMKEEPGFTREDVLLSVTTLSFDISVLEIFLPLICGGRTVLAAQKVAADGKRLGEVLSRSGTTVFQATPVTWRILLESGWRNRGRLKGLIGGEALPADLRDQLLEQGIDLWNMYGPTETTIWSAVKRMSPSDAHVSIGRPVANTQIYILDGNLSPVPIGVPGELYIGGDGVARGYLHRPELTKEKFIRNPFSREPDARIYRTGDLALYLENGDLVCLGRTDFQAKVRGFRVEPGEIEAVLNRHLLVRQSAVAVRPDSGGEAQLVAYTVARDGSAPGIAELRQYLRERLPDYMVPSGFMSLDRLPLTPNGKVDYKALPPVRQPDSSDANMAPAAPRDPLELQMTNLWESVLGVKCIGIRDNFFEIGGHSLVAARLFSRMEKSMGVVLPLAILLQAPTIEMLCSVVRQGGWSAGWACLVPIQPGGSKPPLFFVHGAGGNVLLYRGLARCMGSDQPFYGLQARGLDGREDPMTRFEDMAAHYLQEIRLLQPNGPYYLGGYCLGGAIALEMAQQLRADGERVAFLAMVETYNMAAENGSYPFYLRYYHGIQNVRFHWRNLMSLGAAGKYAFLRDKASTSFQRTKVNAVILLNRLGRNLGLPAASNYPHLSLTRINDHVHLEYVARPYDGKITLFRPMEHFRGYNDPEFGWGKVARGGVEVHRLPFEPRGSLVEPFVTILAAELAKCLDQAERTASGQVPGFRS